VTDRTKTLAYLAERLDGARDLYLLALALGTRDEGETLFGSMIREARIHFAIVIEECRIAGLDTSALATILGKMNKELVNSIRPEIWDRLANLMAQRARGQG
jgi:CRP-like cAMP-binding protein